MKKITLKKSDLRRGSLILVNSDHPLQQEVDSAALCSVRVDYNKILMQKQAVKLLTDLCDTLMCNAAIVPVSGYRTQEDQQRIWDEAARGHGAAFARQYVAIPGCSEHQTGLAVDLAENKPNIDFIRPDFPNTGICEMFRRHAPQYGFIERYPEGREAITHISYEPWHFRYVGYPHAQVMARENMTLEEYIAYLRDCSSRNAPLCWTQDGWDIGIYYVPMQQDETLIELSNNAPYQISGNNSDGFIVTTWEASL